MLEMPYAKNEPRPTGHLLKLIMLGFDSDYDADWNADFSFCDGQRIKVLIDYLNSQKFNYVLYWWLGSIKCLSKKQFNLNCCLKIFTFTREKTAIIRKIFQSKS
jgi:hypothetical protein